ncbi:hypothetical protein ACF0H5_023832 [Mactra antiquata]
MYCLFVTFFLFSYVYSQENVPTVPEVTFSAGLSHDVTFSEATTIIFDTVFTNIGNAYNPSSGIFLCPETGIYLFQYHLVARQGTSAWLELYHNAYYVNSAYTHTTSEWGAAGNSVIMRLSKGDTMFIRSVKNDNGYTTELYGRSDQIYNTFTGYLLLPVHEHIVIG